MGCASSKPSNTFNPQDYESRTQTKGTWDDDFKPRPREPTMNLPLGLAQPPNIYQTPNIPFTVPRGVPSTQQGLQMNFPTQSSTPNSLNPQYPFYSQSITNSQWSQLPLHGDQQNQSWKPAPGGDSARYTLDVRSLDHQQPAHTHVSQPPNEKSAPSKPSGDLPPRPHADPHGHRTLREAYILGQEIGKGAFAKVVVGVEKVTRREYAIKQIYRSKMRWSGRDAVMDEIGNLIKLRNAPNIVYLHEYFLEEKLCHLVMELLPGKALFQRLIQKGTFSEKEARNSCRCLLYALAYMHERRICHRDLKPDNLLLADELDTDKVKLADFGFSKSLATRNECRTLCGTPGFLAPEILERWPAYDVKCDTWSFGVNMFLLLGGYLPFDSSGSNDTKAIFERTRNGQYHFFPQRWKGISPMAKDLIAKCLTVNPNSRISTKAALSHEWMGEGLALPKTMISAASMANVINETRVPRNGKEQRHHDEDQVDRLKELNDDFTVYMAGHAGDSIVSAMCGGVGTFRSTGGHVAATIPLQEDSLTGKPFLHFYRKEDQIGQGSYATVFRCVHQQTGLAYAVKQVDTSGSTRSRVTTLKDEITALKYLRGAPFIIRLFDVFQEGHITYLVLEDMKGGDLLHRIVEKEVYTEREARDVCKALFSAVNYCHKKQIAHRDIKLENLLLKDADDDSSIKLADFGFAKKVNRGKGLHTFLGTISFMAPEIHDLRSNGYDERCDLWSVGVVVFALLGGYLPFEGNVKEAVLQCDYRFHDEYWGDVSLSAKKLIVSLLKVDPKDRITMDQSLASRWMTIDDAELSVVDLSLTKSRMQRMVSVKGQMMSTVIAATQFQEKSVESQALDETTRFRGRDQINPHNYMEALQESDLEMDAEVLFGDVYAIGQPTGVGYLAKIYRARNRITDEEYSVKKIIRKDLHRSDFAALCDELAVLHEVSKGGKGRTVSLHEVYEDPEATYMVMEKIEGEILIDKLLQKKKFTEYDAKELVRNLLHGIHHCHRKKIAIRNLTLDNLILRYGSDSDIVITDFEIAKKVIYPNSLKTRCGTQEFVAPEVLENRPAYDVSCDVWTIGVIVFILLGGYYPFRGKTEPEVLKNIRYGNYTFRKKFWNGVSTDAIALMKSMMTVDPEERPTSAAALHAPWITMDRYVLSNDLTVNVAEIKKEVSRMSNTGFKTDVA